MPSSYFYTDLLAQFLLRFLPWTNLAARIVDITHFYAACKQKRSLSIFYLFCSKIKVKCNYFNLNGRGNINIKVFKCKDCVLILFFSFHMRNHINYCRVGTQMMIFYKRSIQGKMKRYRSEKPCGPYVNVNSWRGYRQEKKEVLRLFWNKMKNTP